MLLNGPDFFTRGCIKYSSLLFKKDQLFKKGPIVKQDIYLVLVLERKDIFSDIYYVYILVYIQKKELTIGLCMIGMCSSRTE